MIVYEQKFVHKAPITIPPLIAIETCNACKKLYSLLESETLLLGVWSK